MPSNGRKKTLGTLVWEAHTKLINDPLGDAYQYLTGPDRGLTEQTLRTFALGVTPADTGEFANHEGWITIPYITRSGIVDVRFRRPPGSTSPAKYKSLPGSQPRLFNPAALTQNNGGRLFVCEGEFDAIMLTQMGLRAVAVPGASAWRKPFAYAMQGEPRITICQDGDDTGSGEKLTATIKKDLDWCKTVVFKGHDVTSYVMEHGENQLLELLGEERNQWKR